MSNRYIVVSDSFDPDAEPTYAGLEAMRTPDLIFLASMHHEPEIIDEMKRRGFDVEKIINDNANEIFEKWDKIFEDHMKKKKEGKES